MGNGTSTNYILNSLLFIKIVFVALQLVVILMTNSFEAAPLMVYIHQALVIGGWINIQLNMLHPVLLRIGFGDYQFLRT